MSRFVTVSITVEVTDPEVLIRDVRERLIEDNAGDEEMVDREVMPDPETDLELVVQHAFDTLGFRSEGLQIMDSRSEPAESPYT